MNGRERDKSFVQNLNNAIVPSAIGFHSITTYAVLFMTITV